MRAIRVHEFGDTDVLQVQDITVPVPVNGELLIRVQYAGVNFADIDHRRGERGSTPPFTVGTEGVGIVEKHGEGVSEPKIGARVVWWNPGTPGAYAEYAVIPAIRAVSVPEMIPSPIAAALMLQGITAHALIERIAPPESGASCLILSAAGGVGHLATQLARSRDARVFGTTSTREKASFVSALGAEEVIVYTEADFADAVLQLTDGKGVRIVYDGIGNDTIIQSIRAAGLLGRVVLYGYKSGGHNEGTSVDIDTRLLAAKAVFLTRGAGFHFVSNREELLTVTDDLFRRYTDGQLLPYIGGEFALEEAAQAHRLMENGGSTGKLVIKVE